MQRLSYLATLPLAAASALPLLGKQSFAQTAPARRRGPGNCPSFSPREPERGRKCAGTGSEGTAAPGVGCAGGDPPRVYAAASEMRADAVAIAY